MVLFRIQEKTNSKVLLVPKRRRTTCCRLALFATNGSLLHFYDNCFRDRVGRAQRPSTSSSRLFSHNNAVGKCAFEVPKHRIINSKEARKNAAARGQTDLIVPLQNILWLKAMSTSVAQSTSETA